MKSEWGGLKTRNTHIGIKKKEGGKFHLPPAMIKMLRYPSNYLFLVSNDLSTVIFPFNSESIYLCIFV